MSNSCAVITGVASGLGNSILHELVARRQHVIGLDIDSEAIRRLQLKFPGSSFICVDVSNSNAFQMAVEESIKLDLPIDALYLVAGIGRKQTFVEQTWEEVSRQVEVNLISRLRMSHCFLDYRKQHSGVFNLVLIGSSTGIQPLKLFSAYSATSAAIEAFGRVLIQEVHEAEGNILLVIPGGMNTRFQESAGVNRLRYEKLLDPQTVAKKIVSSQSNGSRVLVVGRNALITSILSRLLPRLIGDRLWSTLVSISR